MRQGVPRRCGERGDPVVTRLTHTFEAARIARTISRALNVNQRLTKASALGRDIGHAAFGHADDPPEVRAVDDVAGMTDRFAVRVAAAFGLGPPGAGTRVPVRHRHRHRHRIR